MMRLRVLAGIAIIVAAASISVAAGPVLTITLSPSDGGGAIAAAVLKARSHHDGPVDIRLKAGTYYLDRTLTFTAADSRSADAPLTIEADGDAAVTLSAGRRLDAKWSPYRDGIMQTPVPPEVAGAADADFDQLFIDGALQHLARYPNYNPNERYYNGYAPDAISPQRVKSWHNPVGGFVHALHRSAWGGYSYRITGVESDGKLKLEGGWQNNRPGPMSRKYLFVEGVFEELDAPGEWYLDRKAHVLYYKPAPGVDLSHAKVEVSGFDHAVDFAGSMKQPVRYITLRGLRIMHTARTFMKTKEPLLRSDWTIYRGGAVTITGGENIAIDGCVFDHVGGNAVFVNDYNRRVTIEHCIIDGAGASGVCFVGSVDAVRNPLLNYNKRLEYRQADLTPGPKTDDYPADCRVDDCLMHDFGRVEKQVAGVEIDMASRITVSHCSIYNCPRAGINIGDGCWGGHVIEYCDVFNTVEMTGDHGSFNSWGRDRYWHLKGTPGDKLAETSKLDAMEPIVIRNNRWRCDHGWDIDLDDGSSNYHIYNNLCLNGGIKNREGYWRDVENNVIVSGGFNAHVWYPDCKEVFEHNIVGGGYHPIGIRDWGKRIDDNLLPDQAALDQAHRWGIDEHSLAGDPKFIDPATGDYRVADGSPAMKIGFKNFAMDQFGVSSAKLRALAKTPVLPGSQERAPTAVAVQPIVMWHGAQIRKLVGLGERSATGLDSERGVMVVAVPAKSDAYAMGLRENDVILACGGAAVNDPAALVRAIAKATQDGGKVTLSVWRNQAATTLIIDAKRFGPRGG